MEEKHIVYYTIKQVADRYKISQSKVYELTNSGKLGALKIGKSIRISNKDLEAFEKRYHQGAKRQRPF